MKCYKDLSSIIVSHIENLFNSIGLGIAKNPWKTIAICWLFVFVSMIGLLRFHQEKNPVKLWTPPNSDFAHDTEWLLRTFRKGYRPQITLVKAKDVLTPEVLREVNLVNKKVFETVTPDGITWTDVCFKLPLIDVGIASLLNLNSKSNNTQDDLDPSMELPQSDYCKVIEIFEEGCLIRNLLEIWKFSDEKLETVTKEEIVNKLATTKISPITGHPVQFEKLLGGIKRNESGHIVAAETLLSFWMVFVNFTAVDMNKVGNDMGTADWATEDTLDWEKEFLKTMNDAENSVKNFELFYMSSRSYGDISGVAMLQDIPMLVIGVVFMVIYVQLVLSKYNWVESRIVLGFLGLVNTGMAFVVACSLCSLFGIFYGPVHTSFPFLLMGLGVDDLFVMMTCWNQHSSDTSMPLPERIGLMLRHAGVSITITSLTDFVVFLIGSSTVLPSLRSYCVYSAVGILATYIFAITFFTACFTLDQKRLEQNRNSIFPWYIHESYEKKESSQTQYMKKALEFIYSKIIFTTVGKVTVILLAILFAGIGIDGTLKLKQKFEPMWLIPKSTYLSQYFYQTVEYYPTMGFDAYIYLGNLNYTKEFSKIKLLELELENSTDIINVTSSWVNPFSVFVKTHFNKDLDQITLSENDWSNYLSRYLFSVKGSKYQENFQFESDLKCGKPADQILVSSINIQFKRFNGPDQYLPAMHKLYDMTKKANFSTGDRVATVWGNIYRSWVTDEIIDSELARNLQLALICVMACTFVLIANIHMCFWIFICVLLTMISVCSFMHMWDLTIDVTSCVALTLAIGLCVDYAAHIGYTFLATNHPTREKRILETVTSIGAAVLNGGFSTLLAISMISQSDSYTFQSFFKIFVLVVLFGQFYGIVFLPVILSLIGPKPFHSHKKIQQTEELDQKELEKLPPEYK